VRGSTEALPYFMEAGREGQGVLLNEQAFDEEELWGVADPGGLCGVMHEGGSRWAAQNAGLQISRHPQENPAQLLSELMLQATLLHPASF